MYRFEVIAPHQFLCTLSSEPELAVHDATLTSFDQSTLNTLKRSTQEIQVCVSKLTPKRGKGTPRGEGAEAEEGETINTPLGTYTVHVSNQ